MKDSTSASTTPSVTTTTTTTTATATATTTAASPTANKDKTSVFRDTRAELAQLLKKKEEIEVGFVFTIEKQK